MAGGSISVSISISSEAAGRHGRRRLALLAVAVVLLALHGGAELAAATEWYVGDANGWTFGVMPWPNFKPFREGDVLVFKYDPAMHNVVMVNDFGFGTCTHLDNAKVYSSGNDRITLPRGQVSFICAKPGHCDKGLKMTLTVRP